MILTIINLASAVLGAITLAKLMQVAKKHRFVAARARTIAPDKMPSVSVCIPARNEEHAMARCLDAVIASDYPKLEMVVLDDHSVDDTSALVKSYANEGVRFVKGADLPEGWIGRNFAYESLSKQASGKYIFFMSVDTHIGPETISQLVAYMMHKRVEMISVLPSRLDNYRPSVLVAPLRHLHELIFSSRKSPATISSGWLVNRELLGEYCGDLSELKGDIMIERRIAEKFVANENGGYDFIINAHECDVSFEKKWSSQIEASMRAYALSTDKNLFKFAGMLLALLLASCLPLSIALSAIFGWSLAAWLAVVAELIYMATYTYYASLTWSRGAWLAPLFWPFVAVQELVVLVASAIKRKRGTITWKGRPVFSR
ncbi:MAG: glycosyltransferase [Candidatus Nomurabacteria bacterium]|jgi:glycosyltransferase involved in cell wall biosynthesis|nr:glycosyltransferase [Candidatus Nomurabacteria bacterium]